MCGIKHFKNKQKKVVKASLYKSEHVHKVFLLFVESRGWLLPSFILDASTFYFQHPKLGWKVVFFHPKKLAANVYWTKRSKNVLTLKQAPWFNLTISKLTLAILITTIYYQNLSIYYNNNIIKCPYLYYFTHRRLQKKLITNALISSQKAGPFT